MLRRRAGAVDGTVTLADGRELTLDRSTLLAPLEGALAMTAWGIVLLAAALAVARLG
jgi:hypothetical protein